MKWILFCAVCLAPLNLLGHTDFQMFVQALKDQDTTLSEQDVDVFGDGVRCLCATVHVALGYFPMVDQEWIRANLPSQVLVEWVIRSGIIDGLGHDVPQKICALYQETSQLCDKYRFFERIHDVLFHKAKIDVQRNHDVLVWQEFIEMVVDEVSYLAETDPNAAQWSDLKRKYLESQKSFVEDLDMTLDWHTILECINTFNALLASRPQNRNW